jgi:predicted permease
MRDWLQELRYSARALAKTPGFTLVAVLSLALGIGANTAVFAVVRSMLIAPLPVAEPGRLAVAHWTRANRDDGVWQLNESGFVDPSTGRRFNTNYSSSVFNALRASVADVADVFAFTFVREANVSFGDASRSTSTFVGGMMVSDNYFAALGVPMTLGRGLDARDDRADAEPSVVLSHALWRRGFGGDPAVVGKLIRINGVSYTVVGVTSPKYYGVSKGGFFPPADVTVALGMQPRVTQPFSGSFKAPSGPLASNDEVLWLRVMTRLKPAAGRENVESRMSTAFAALMKSSEVPALRRAESPALHLSQGDRGLDSLRRGLEQPLLMLAAVVGFVFLVACANLASLVLVRGVARRRDLWIRMALGCSHARLVRQTLSESLLLAAAGGLASLVLAGWSVRAIFPLLAGPRAISADLLLDWSVLAVAAIASCAAGLLFGLAPAIRLASATSGMMRSSAIAAAIPRLRISRYLIALQIAISVPLVVGAVLLLRTVHNLNRVDVGFDPAGLVVFRVDPTLNAYSPSRTDAYVERLIARLHDVAGVRSASLMDSGLITNLTSNTTVSVEGTEDRGMLFKHVSPEFFDTVGLPIVAGRAFDRRDRAGAPRVAIVNEAAARQRFSGAAIGRRLVVRGFGKVVEYEVVGVARVGRNFSLRERRDAPMVFVPATQAFLPLRTLYVAVRTDASPETAERIRAAAAAVDPDVPAWDPKPQVDQIQDSIARERVFSSLLTFFGGFALLLACVGLHTITAYSVARRTSEIGVRMALGADPRQVRWLVLRQVMAPAAVGLAMGLPIALAGGRALRSMLFELEPGDPLSLAIAAGVMFAVAIAAGVRPARRATRVDPVMALRAE